MFPNTVMKSFSFTWATLRVFERACDSTSHAHGHRPGRPPLRGDVGLGPAWERPEPHTPAATLRPSRPAPPPASTAQRFSPSQGSPRQPCSAKGAGSSGPASLHPLPARHSGPRRDTPPVGPVEAALSPGPRPGLSGRESREDSDGAGDGPALTGVPLILVPR